LIISVFLLINFSGLFENDIPKNNNKTIVLPKVTDNNDSNSRDINKIKLDKDNTQITTSADAVKRLAKSVSFFNYIIYNNYNMVYENYCKINVK
jgi:hypothetical protein